MCYTYLYGDIDYMDKEKIKNFKNTMTNAAKDPLGTCLEISYYIVCLAVGIWILGFALSFMIKIMKPMILLT